MFTVFLEGTSTVEGTIKGTFAITAYDGNGGNYEAYGRFYIDDNKVWDVKEGSAVSVANGETLRIPINCSVSVPEGHTFILYGKAMENDPTGDDLIGNYDNTAVPMTDIIDGKEWSETFPGGGRNYVKIIELTLQRK